MVDNGHIVSRGDRIAEWDPSFSPVITERAGTVKFQDLIENRTLVEQTDESTGISQRAVIDDIASRRRRTFVRA
jgi:DNA-directed RNA polymerase subunit beta'